MCVRVKFVLHNIFVKRISSVEIVTHRVNKQKIQSDKIKGTYYIFIYSHIGTVVICVCITINNNRGDSF